MFGDAFKIVEQFVQKRNSSAAVALIGWQGKNYGPRAWGSLSFFPGAQPPPPAALFDLASLSKVISTTTLTLILKEEGLFKLDTKLGELIPQAPAEKKRLRCRSFLAHTSGLPAVYPFYKDPGFKNKGTALETVLKVPLSYPPGRKVQYSCVGFITLGLVLEKITASSLDILFQNKIAAPLGLKDTGYNPSGEKLARTAFTEWDPREKVFLHGVVHDENARALGGVGGNAGLFGTAADLAVFAAMLLKKGEHLGQRILSSGTVQSLQRNFSPDPAEPRTLGWLLPSPKACSGGPLLSPFSLGHTGFTGTSLWLDFKRAFFGILLTNRVHPTRQNTAVLKLRPQFYEAVCQAIDAAR